MSQTQAALRHDVDLRAFNTFGLSARARRYAEIRSVDQLREVLRSQDGAEPFLVLGGGSNVVLTRDYEGLVLRMAIGGRAWVGEDDRYHYVRVGAGEHWSAFVDWTLSQGWPGLENLSLIPGTVGAAPVQNIGAYGLEMAERFASLEAVSVEDGRLHHFSAADCAFAYRDSVFKRAAARRFVITAVTFRLPRQWQPITHYAALAHELGQRGLKAPNARQIADAVIAIRQRKLPDPATVGNAGSFFKNPVVETALLQQLRSRFPDVPAHARGDGRYKLPAGWLIDRCGWKGRTMGAVGCFDKQALVLVNRGGATGEDVCRIAQAIQRDVSDRFGVALEPEPLFV